MCDYHWNPFPWIEGGRVVCDRDDCKDCREVREKCLDDGVVPVERPEDSKYGHVWVVRDDGVNEV